MQMILWLPSVGYAKLFSRLNIQSKEYKENMKYTESSDFWEPSFFDSALSISIVNKVYIYLVILT